MQNDLLSIQRYGQENNLLVGFSRFYDTAIELILIGLLVFTPLVFGTVQVWSISVMHLATLFMLALWFLKMNAQGRFRLVRTPLDLPILAFGAIAVVSTVTSVYFYESKVELNLAPLKNKLFGLKQKGTFSMAERPQLRLPDRMA